VRKKELKLVHPSVRKKELKLASEKKRAEIGLFCRMDCACDNSSAWAITPSMVMSTQVEREKEREGESAED
jgi:hypothetical protein